MNPKTPGYAPSGKAAAPAADYDRRWRQEVISRVQQHRARRRKRGDSDASLEFDFPVEREEMNEPAYDEPTYVEPTQYLEPEEPAYEEPAPPRVEPPKIIRFPRSNTVQAGPLPQYDMVDELELAEPVIDAPRILEAPEPPAQQMDLLPSFDDIRLGAEENRSAHAFDLPLQPASLQQRLFAGMIDAGVVLAASAMLIITFMALSTGMPQARMIFLFTCLTGATLWLLYQYLFLVYSSGTLGMQMAQLELCTFNGEPVPVEMRRWRALASMLSGCSLGLGFAWAFVDEDTLSWHDRITQTHLRTVQEND
jgi:uncharacterized RDD family membrane protein YckC